jgi:biopolymer transport protein TolR
MGMASGGAGGGGGRRRGRRRRGSGPMSEINITPMVDVMLVLLIIFMVAAPMMTVGVPIDLPKTAAKQLDSDQEPISISVDKSGAVFLGDQPVAIDALIDAIGQQAQSTDDTIFLRGDGATSYGAVMQVMGELSAAGYTKLRLITEQAQDQ